MERSDIEVTGVEEAEERKNRTKAIIWRNSRQNFPKLMKVIKPHSKCFTNLKTQRKSRLDYNSQTEENQIKKEKS